MNDLIEKKYENYILTFKKGIQSKSLVDVGVGVLVLVIVGVGVGVLGKVVVGVGV